MKTSHWLHRIAGALIFCSLGAAPLVAADKRPFASSDFTSLRSAVPVAISPDGKAILFDVHFFDEKGAAKDEWHTVPAAGGDASCASAGETLRNAATNPAKTIAETFRPALVLISLSGYKFSGAVPERWEIGS